VVYRTLGRNVDTRSVRTQGLITELDVKDLPFGGQIRVPSGALITPLARQVAMDRHITIIEEGPAQSPALSIQPALGVSAERIVEVGSHYRPPQHPIGRIITEQDVKDLAFGSVLSIPEDATVTPLARQTAMDRHITLDQAERTSEALAIKPDSQVSGERIERVARHFRTPQRTSSGMVTELDVRDLPFGSELTIPPGATITPLARQVAMDRRVTFREGTPSSRRISTPTAVDRSTQTGKTIALGADHGGFTMKEDLKRFLSESGYAVVDCGTDSSDSVDYPDYAYAVAQLVASGQAWRGVIVDGAGIGSCMTANKVPGVLAAMCYDQATAYNSREHNNANVLTLGAGLIGSNLARQITQTFLETNFGGGRHARRVDKITEIERRFVK
jgi:ribose 5-phosphate isomerase B